jgi:hypothetical protein
LKNLAQRSTQRSWGGSYGDLKATAPTILAFGKETHNILSKNLNKNEYRKLIKLTHYSHQIGKEAYIGQ